VPTSCSHRRSPEIRSTPERGALLHHRRHLHGTDAIRKGVERKSQAVFFGPPGTGKISWTVQVRIGTKSDGRPRWLTKTFERQKDAKAYFAKVIKDRDSGLVVQPSKMLLNEFLDRWLESAVEPRVRANTYRSYRWQLKKYVRDQIGSYRLCDISPLQIQKLYSELNREGLSSRVVRYTHTILNNAFGQAVKWRMLASNPCSGAELPRSRQKEAQVLTVEEVARFVNVLSGTRHEVLLLVALTTGMRPSEYLALQWKDIDFDGSRIQVRRSLDWRRKGQWEFSEPKTARSRRSIPFPKEVLDRLQHQRRVQAEQRLKAGPDWRNHNLVFSDRRGEPFDRQNLLRRHLRPSGNHPGQLALTALPVAARRESAGGHLRCGAFPWSCRDDSRAVQVKSITRVGSEVVRSGVMCECEREGGAAFV
jgi:integrase